MMASKLDDYLEKRLQDPAFKAAFEVENEKLVSAVSLAKAREEIDLTQGELAELVSVSQPTESVNNTNFEKGTKN